MPTYQYHCKDCNNDLEVFQKFSDSALTVCPNCQGRLRKVYSAVGVVFKGSGFYATDNRSKGATSASLPAPDHQAPESGGPESGSPSTSSTGTTGDSTATVGSTAAGDSAA